MSAKILVPLPAYGFDPTEAAIPWQLLSERGHQLIFSTPQGRPAAPDVRMLRGENLGIWKPLLRARKDAVEACLQMMASPEFQQPISYPAASAANYAALLLPGGHDQGMREYLEAVQLQQLVVDFFTAQKPVAAICHGVVLAARSIDPATAKSVLHGYQTTALLKKQELLAYQLTRAWLQDYYLTYPGLTVEDEVVQALASAAQFQPGPNPLLRDSLTQLQRGFTVRDRNYLSARWPGDAYAFSLRLAQMLE